MQHKLALILKEKYKTCEKPNPRTKFKRTYRMEDPTYSEKFFPDKSWNKIPPN